MLAQLQCVHNYEDNLCVVTLLDLESSNYIAMLLIQSRLDQVKQIGLIFCKTDLNQEQIKK